jgi:prepilin signal peptidase PulO-like enzyme (type II secretory pathway)
MSTSLALVCGATVGFAAGALLLPVTRRELAAATKRAGSEAMFGDSIDLRWHQVALVVVSGVLPGFVLYREGWSLFAIPPLLLFLGLVPLAYCDAKRHLLPKRIVYSTTACVAISAIVAAGVFDVWHRLLLAVLCSIGFVLLLFAINLMNPAWMAFGDVRLAPAVGLGLAWISPMALLEGFFLANLAAALFGLILIAIRRNGRKDALPFGLYLAIATVAVILTWSA